VALGVYFAVGNPAVIVLEDDAQATQRQIEAMVERYGDFVLYRPPLKASTLLLWCGPFLLLGLGLFLFARRVRSGSRQAAPLSDAERARAAALLEPGKK